MKKKQKFCIKYLFQIVYSVFGALSAPILGLYILGFFFPRVNNRSASIGFFTSLLFQLWVIIGANLTRHLQPKRILGISTDGCQMMNRTNLTMNPINKENASNFFLPLYSISMMWYAFNGVMLTVILGLVASFICGIEI